MKVAHIAFQYGLNNTGGAAIAATRLHQALLKHGVDSHYICVHACEKGENVHELPRGWKRKLFLALAKLTRCIWKFTPYRRSICLNFVPMFGLKAELRKINPDVVHVQWVNNDVCSFAQLAKLPYKMVFNLHDLFVINAIQPYPCKDRRFVTGFDKTNSTRLERWLFNRKWKMIAALQPSFIGPSEWVAGECRASLIGKGLPALAIPNLPDPTFMQDCTRRAAFGYLRSLASRRSPGESRFVILFGAYGGRGNRLKGFDDLVQALKLLPPEMKAQSELHVFGESAADCEIEGVPMRFLGPVSSPHDLIKIYQSADVFAFPSREETQGMTKVEALLCGLPVVAFNRTACAEGIELGSTGWVAPNGDFAAYAEGLSHYFSAWKSGELSAAQGAITAAALNRFRTDSLVNEIGNAYSQAIMGAVV